MDLTNMECSEPSVDPGAFWHANMDLYFGYQLGEIVEVQHEPNKYWPARIQYCYKHLLLLRWVGNYGEFWIDTALSNATTSISCALDESRYPKRLFPLGYHAQSQSKSQVAMEKPTKVLVTPSLYDPARDPYADIKTIDDLLAIDENESCDKVAALVSETHGDNIDLALVCKKKIQYKQEDVEELETALQNLNDMDNDESGECLESPDPQASIYTSNNDKCAEGTNAIKSKEGEEGDIVIRNKDSGIDSGPSSERASASPDRPMASAEDKKVDTTEVANLTDDGKALNIDPDEDTKRDNLALELCRALQSDAINKKTYNGLNAEGTGQSDDSFLLKMKQLYDIGGANHEKVFVPGTLVEVFHTAENAEGNLDLMLWFAYVVKNNAGRLTLRWFLCDEPKFKQGRLEIKSSRSKLVLEESEEPTDTAAEALEEGSKTPEELEDIPTPKQDGISAKSITFSMHFCHPKIQTVPYSDLTEFEYILPKKITNYIEQNHSNSEELIKKLTEEHIKHVLDTRRMNLDKDRPLIDHILDTARQRAPTYLDKVFFNNNKTIPHQVLISCPKMTKLHKAAIIRKFRTMNSNTPIFEVHSEPLEESGDIIKFIYPLDNSYCVLPLDWATNNKDCLSSDLQELFDESNQDTDVTNQRHTEFELKEMVESSFKEMDQLEVVHPTSDSTICLGRIRKVVYPLIWIQLSADCYTLVPFNTTDIYPVGWCNSNGHKLVSLLPPRKRCIDRASQGSSKSKRKKLKVVEVHEASEDEEGPGNDDDHNLNTSMVDYNQMYEKEHFDLGEINYRQLDFDFILQEKTNYIKIFFNHKCFTGPSLSKSKICSLTQYVGPGPMNLVLEEVVTKVISVAYVPPRILNDLSSKSFQELLVERQLTNTKSMTFKAKYQKRVHRERVPVCLSIKDIAAYCECICEHLKCCYNLFGPNLYDGDDCPSHCRSLTKSNKFMKRATYYREKARQGEFLGNDNQSGTSKKINATPSNNSASQKLSRARYVGRGSSESTNSSILSRLEQIPSRASSSLSGDADGVVNDLKENLKAVMEEAEHDIEQVATITTATEDVKYTVGSGDPIVTPKQEPYDTYGLVGRQETPESDCQNQPEFGMFDSQKKLANVEDWTVEDVAHYLDWCQLGVFKSNMESEGIDGQALLLLDNASIKEHFQGQKCEFSAEEVSKLCRFVDLIKTRTEARLHSFD